jgi:translation initiation factor IF-1
MFKKFFRRLFHKKEKESLYINPYFTTYIDESLTNKNLRKYDSKALLKAFKKSKINKTVKILANDKIEIKLKPWDFEKMGISEEQLKKIQKQLIEDIIVDLDREFITGRKSSD